MEFLKKLKRIANTGQARSVLITGNVHDLFFDGTKFVPLIELIQSQCQAQAGPSLKGLAHVLYEIHHPIEVKDPSAMAQLEGVWAKYHPQVRSDTRIKLLADRFRECLESTPYALELLRQITECTQREKLSYNLLMIIEGADLLIPDAEISRMNRDDRKSLEIVLDWFSDPNFVNGHETVFMIAESSSGVHSRITKLPQLINVDVPLPDLETRERFIGWWVEQSNSPDGFNLDFIHKLAERTAGLSIHALNQLIRSGDLSPAAINTKIEEFMTSQLGAGVVEFKRPTHLLSNCVGNTRLKKFIEEEIKPGILAEDDTALAGILVCGPIGTGKSYIFEALASEIDVPVIILKNIRSKWYGETDEIFERLERLLRSFRKVIIFVDEADAQFGDIDSDQETERRLTGKIQAMMSDPELRGRVVWILMTARPHKLSPDIRRPGRMDMIIPILDPKGEDFDSFAKWVFGEYGELDEKKLSDIKKVATSAASFSLLKTRLKRKKPQSFDEAMKVAGDLVLPDIAATREYQALQAMVNCTERSMVDEGWNLDGFYCMRETWQKQIHEMEAKGVE